MPHKAVKGVGVKVAEQYFFLYKSQDGKTRERQTAAVSVDAATIKMHLLTSPLVHSMKKICPRNSCFLRCGFTIRPLLQAFGNIISAS